MRTSPSLGPSRSAGETEHDKLKVESIAPISATMNAAIDAYLKRAGVFGDTRLFPSPRHERQATSKNFADYWLGMAEKRAELPHLERRGWHAFRRA